MTDILLFWNVWALGTSQIRLHSIMWENNLAMVAISELFATDDKIPRFASFLDVSNFVVMHA